MVYDFDSSAFGGDADVDGKAEAATTMGDGTIGKYNEKKSGNFRKSRFVKKIA